MKIAVEVMITLLLLIQCQDLAAAPEGFPYQLTKYARCPDRCGDVSIPYPFGTKEGCYYNDGSDGYQFFNLTCNHDNNTPTLIYGTDIKVEKIMLDGQIQLFSYVSYDCYANNSETGAPIADKYSRPGFDDNHDPVKFTLNSSGNILAAIGCDTKATFQFWQHDTYFFFLECNGYCFDRTHVENGTCAGVGCCQIPIPEGVTKVNTFVTSYNNHSHVLNFNPCGSSFVVAKEAFNLSQFSLANLTRTYNDYYSNYIGFPTIYDWTIGNENCTTVQKKDKSYLCGEKTRCADTIDTGAGYRCQCLPGYHGNPYLAAGCQDIDECAGQGVNECEKKEYCRNTPGGYICGCPHGSHGSGTKAKPCRENFPKLAKLLTGAGAGFIILVILAFGLFWQYTKTENEEVTTKFLQTKWWTNTAQKAIWSRGPGPKSSNLHCSRT